jgi:subtilisin-like proprotein convertase family protein
VVATITSPNALDASSLYVHWGVGALTDSLLMTATANPNEYAASIPGPLSNVSVRYYIVAKDTGGGRATHPVGAPASYHQFHVGLDTTPPVIAHTAIANWPLVSWPPAVNATVTDNLGVNTISVAVNWTLNGIAKTAFGLTRVGTTSSYTGSFPPGGVAAGDSVAYHITAQDVALIPNTGRSPLAGEHRFAVIDILGRVLVVDDDEVAKIADVKLVPVDSEKGPWQPLTEKALPADDGIQSANAMAAVLNTAGYLATVQTMASTNPATWSTYDLIISASGANTGPVASATYRSALETWVAGGHKLLVEGGEVVYDAASYPGYPTFAANVLHTTDWDADNAGALNLISAQASHPIATTPYALPSSMSIAYASYGTEDAYKPNAPAYIVYGTASYPTEGGILVYDNTPAPQSAQVVLFGFDYKVVADATTRGHLLLNTVAYLLASEPVADAGISGVALLANHLDHSGITITLSPGGATATTASNGSYAFASLYPGTYTVTASKATYKSETRTGVVVAAHTTTADQNFKLYPQQEAQYCLTPNLAIPDNSPTGVSSVVTVSQTWAVQSVEVQVNITHTYIGDLIVELRHGTKIVRLHNKTGSSNDNIIGTFPTTIVVDGPGALTDFTGDAANGTWTLFLSDNASTDTGTLVSWCLKLKGPADTTVDTDPADRLPQVAALAAGTNPMGAAGTTIRFALPQAKQASLVVYNVAGQRVRTLVDAVTPAGYHDVHWDGRDGEGSRVAAGVYFYQLVSGETTLTRKLVVVR